MASENVRGKMISMYQLMVTLGIVLAFLSDTAFSYSGNWRAMLGVLALPAVLLIILVLPNSPRWLAEKGRHIEAEEVLRMLRDTSEAREELNEIRESLKLKQGGWGNSVPRSTVTSVVLYFSVCCCRRCSSLPV